MILLSHRTPVAKKDYSCDACVWIFESDYRHGLTISEYRSIVKAQRNGCKIRAGEKYIYQASINYGDFCTFRAIPAIFDICIKYDMFECD